MRLESLPRVPLAHLPTPLEEMARLSRELSGPRLLIKRDDQTGLAAGGNKARKLEFLIAEALAQGADMVVTLGAAQSNHARQTAAAAAKVGLEVILLLRGQEEPSVRQGNLLLDDLLGAQVRWTGPERRLATERTEEILEEIKKTGRKPYLIPYGGSNEVGIVGYILAVKELLPQLEERGVAVDYIVSASSSGGTQVGLLLGAKIYGYKGKVVGISVDSPKEKLISRLRGLAEATMARWQLAIEVRDQDFVVYDDYTGGGYGVLGPSEVEAIRLLARTEGILLDPVYTGRAMAGLIDLIRKGAFAPQETVLFWHTGGTPALFAYAEALTGARSER